jgi:hypothetical protein|tara:strand:+ start:517 stop:1494 length:978 start_codon:yes stop_codon:yes gene_type:complete
MPFDIITGLVGMGLSFDQAAKARDEQRKAEFEAEKQLKEAKMLLEKNFYEGIAIPKETYDLQADILKTAGEQAISAAQEAGVRATSVAPGRVLAGLTQSGGKMRTDMASELLELEKAEAKEASRLRDMGVGIRGDVATGAGLAAAAADIAEAQAITGGAEAAQVLGEEIFEATPIYGKGQKGRMLTRAQRKAGGFDEFKDAIVNKFGDQGLGIKKDGVELKISQARDPKELLNFLQGQSIEDIEELGGTSAVRKFIDNLGEEVMDIPSDILDAVGNIPQFFSNNPFLGTGDYKDQGLGAFFKTTFGKKEGGSKLGNLFRNIFKKK